MNDMAARHDEVLSCWEAAAIRKVMAVIGESADAESVGVHRALGFTQLGSIASCGWKLGVWRDLVIMQKGPGVGNTQPPLDLPGL